MLQQRGLDATIDLVGTALDEKPEETVAVILGELKTVTEGRGSRIDRFGMQDQLLKFVQGGGALLVASDSRSETLRPTNICGTVRPPLARCIISGLRSGLAQTSTSAKVTPFCDKSLFDAITGRDFLQNDFI